ncbi:MAG: recombinase family protein [Beijerinckiaceae bacterium]|nr:MAG: recombinase family protein [Beijerinckiaceae bacterium]
MSSSPQKPQRCAIYTRKSTEHNLDLAFNSLDAQREACEAYVKSQTHEGWSLIPDRFDDGGLSGASLDRPALQKLLEEVRTRKIDVIVVYKVDRLTRSLADFAKLVELFDQHGVSFVSVTQSFNTTSSMGRLTLNVLLSFAQFEREVIGERVRDKIAASKRKGLWVGGPVPLGYQSVDKKIQVAAEEAALVRKIFADYLRLGSIGELAASFEREGVRPEPRRLVNGRLSTTERLNIGPLAYILKNRFYVGEIAYRGEIHKGQHEAIITRDLFDAVQARLAEGTVARRKTRTQSKSVLAGLIFDDRSNPMSPSHTNKKGIRYRYYVSQAILQKRRAEAGSVVRVSAPDVETIISETVRDRRALDQARPSKTFEPETVEDCGIMSVDSAVIAETIERVIVHRSDIEIIWRRAESEINEANCGSQRVPFEAHRPFKKGIIDSPNVVHMDPRIRTSLLEAIAKAQRWMSDIIMGKIESLDEIAARENIVERYARRLSSLAFLSPRIIQAIIDGTAPAHLTVTRLTQTLPQSWAAQEQMFGVS